MLAGCLLLTLYERYLIGVFCVLIGAVIVVVSIVVKTRQRKP